MKNPIPADEWHYIDPLMRCDNKPVKRMLELGNKKNSDGVYKHYFESLGIEHTSIDWNGEDGALPLDLREPIYKQFEQFDMTTNVGTTEHVSFQRGVWENIHYLTAVYGVIVSITPYPGGDNWWWHGEWYPRQEFFTAFAFLNGYEIEKIGTGREAPNLNLCVRLIKTTEKPFTMPDESLIYRNVIRPR